MSHTRAPLAHILKVSGCTTLVTALAMRFGLGVHFAGSLTMLVLLAALVSLVSVCVGAGTLIAVRALLKLDQVGFLIQSLTSWALGSLFIKAAAVLFAGAITVESIVLAGIPLMVGVWLGILVSGELPTRRLLPVRSKGKGEDKG